MRATRRLLVHRGRSSSRAGGDAGPAAVALELVVHVGGCPDESGAGGGRETNESTWSPDRWLLGAGVERALFLLDTIRRRSRSRPIVRDERERHAVVEAATIQTTALATAVRGEQSASRLGKGNEGRCAALTRRRLAVGGVVVGTADGRCSERSLLSWVSSGLHAGTHLEVHVVDAVAEPRENSGQIFSGIKRAATKISPLFYMQEPMRES